MLNVHDSNQSKVHTKTYSHGIIVTVTNEICALLRAYNQIANSIQVSKRHCRKVVHCTRLRENVTKNMSYLQSIVQLSLCNVVLNYDVRITTFLRWAAR